MEKINWFPEYWNFVEKTKLFDFWRSRYCKNQVYFSPNNENVGGVGFFDASYEYLKHNDKKNRHEKVKEEYFKRKKMLEEEFKHSSSVDQKRLLLLIETEEKAYEYWLAKMVLKPIEDDVPFILKQSIWLIDEKERVFKEAMSNLIEYDRRNLSPVTFPERNLIKEPINLSECHYWLIRENRVFPVNSEDKKLLEKNQSKIQELDKNFLINIEFKPKLLIDRHQRAIKKESGKGFERTKNGEIIKDKEVVDFFKRPEIVYSNELKEESVLIQIEKFLSNDLEKYHLDDFNSEIKIFKTDQNNNSLIDVIKKDKSKQKNKQIPTNPYVILHSSLFSVLEKGDVDDKKNVLEELKKHIKEKQENKKSKKQSKKNENSIEEGENKNTILKSIFYFFKNKENKIVEKELKQNESILLDKEKMIKEEGLVFLKEKEEYDKLQPEKVEKLEEFAKEDLDLLPNYEDDFDDKTRFNFFIRDKNGFKFDRKSALNKIIKIKKDFSNKFKAISNKILNKNFIEQLKNNIIKTQSQDKEFKLGLETPEERMSIKLDNFEFKRQLERIKQEMENKGNHFSYPTYKPK